MWPRVRDRRDQACWAAEVLALLTLLFPAVTWAETTVSLEWRPARQAAEVGETIEIGLYAVSDSGFDKSVGAIGVVFIWDPSTLELLGNVDPCYKGTCPPNAYEWMYSSFRNDVLGDGLNADCGKEEFCDPYTSLPFNDGNAHYLALGRMSGDAPALATPKGLLVTLFRFQTLSAGLSELRLEEQLGEATRTLVIDGEDTGVIITGALGPPAEVVIAGCSPPTVSAIGPRYLAVTPPSDEHSTALLVTGDPDDPKVACASLYVQGDGTLGAAPLFLTFDEWGTVHVSDSQIRPSTTYQVQAVCEANGEPGSSSSPVSATTWQWGDVNNDGAAFMDDVTLVMNGALGIFGGDTILENLDLSPCVPDQQIDDQDISSVQGAFAGERFACPKPCFVGPGLDEFAEFVACMGGPGTQADEDCDQFDSDNDGHVDMVDFGMFQTIFDGPPGR